MVCDVVTGRTSEISVGWASGGGLLGVEDWDLEEIEAVSVRLQ